MNIDWLKGEVAAALEEHQRASANDKLSAHDLPQTVVDRVKRRLVREIEDYELKIKKAVDHAFEKEREVVL